MVGAPVPGPKSFSCSFPKTRNAQILKPNVTKHSGAGDPADTDVQLLIARFGQLEQDALYPPLGPRPHQAREEPRKHPRPSVHVGTPLIRAPAEWYRSGSLRSRGGRGCYPPKALMSLFFVRSDQRTCNRTTRPVVSKLVIGEGQ